MNNYKQQFYLSISPTGRYGGLNAKITKSITGLGKNERLLKLTIEVPKSLWDTPQLEASIKIPESSVFGPVIKTEVLDNIKTIIQQETGMSITLNLIEPTTAESQDE